MHYGFRKISIFVEEETFLKRISVLHPYLFALYPVLALFSHNAGQVAFTEILLPSIASLALAFLLALITEVIFKDYIKGGILTSLFLILFFSYGHIVQSFESWYIGSFRFGSHKSMYTFSFLFLLAGFIILRRTSKSPVALSKILTIISSVLILFPLVSVSHFKLRAASSYRDTRNLDSYVKELSLSSDKQGGPDIYYIILDRYAGDGILEEFYDYDNKYFSDFLLDRGFYLATGSFSNYQMTSHSLASSLNIEYINYLNEEIGDESSDWMPLFSRLEDNTVWRFLKEKGYKYIHFGPKWQPTSNNKYADININYYALPEFTSLLLRTTMVLPILNKFEIAGTRMEKYKRILYEFEKLAEIPYKTEPTFVFAHMLIPHGPFVFDKNGNYITSETLNKMSREEKILEQLEFANTKIMQLVDEILERSDTPPIIIIQGDEGPYPPTCLDSQFNWTRATDSELKLKLSILNAYFLPGVAGDMLYPWITPVNSFRLIFNLYFGTNLELLPDKNYVIQDINHLYKYYDVTEKIR